MTINSEKVDDVILINEVNGKKYYFWITTNVGEIDTIDDVKTAEIKMDSYDNRRSNMGRIKNEESHISKNFFSEIRTRRGRNVIYKLTGVLKLFAHTLG